MGRKMAAEQSLWTFTVLLALLLIGIDAAAPRGLNVAILYVTLLLPSLWSRSKTFTYFVAVVATCLVLQGLFFSRDASHLVSWPIANRLLTVSVIWTTAFLCVHGQHGAALQAKAKLQHTEMLEEYQQLRLVKASLEETNRELAATKDVAIYTLAKLAELRDTKAGQHLERIQIFSLILARQLRRDSIYAHMIDDSFLRDLYHASILHDIGKVAIKDEVLLKPGRLTPAEFESMKLHTLIGTNILEATSKHKKHTDFLEMATVIARCHHERFDGSGYPDGLAGTTIPLPARIVAVADVYDALISERPYKAAYSPSEARDMIVQESCRHFDPIVVQAFQQRFDDFVRLELQCRNNKHGQIFDPTDSLIGEFCSFESDDPANDSRTPEAVAAGTSP